MNEIRFIWKTKRGSHRYENSIKIDLNGIKYGSTVYVQGAQGPLANLYKSGSESLGAIQDGKFLNCCPSVDKWCSMK
jgi:hypothetical protein